MLLDVQYNCRYADLMKAAISIPHDLFVTAEQLAARLGISRSELYVTALHEYVAAHRYDGITECLNAIYEEEPSSLDFALMELQVRSLPSEDW